MGEGEKQQMSPLPLVSVVTPSLNQAGFIREAIDSVLAQDYPRLEYLVVDGGSIDGTLDILRSYGDRLQWISEPDAGQSDAINKGWRRAGGEVIAWLNSDDVYLPGAVRRAVAHLQKHPEAAGVYGDCYFVDAQGRELERYPARPYDYGELVRRTVNYIPQPATFLHRTVLDSVGFLDPGLAMALDLEYWLRLGLQHSLVYLPQPLACLRLHSSCKSVAHLRRYGPELIRIYRRLFARPDLPPAIRALKAEAMSNIHYRVADEHLWAGDFAEARRYVLRGWRHAPGRPSRVAIKVLVVSLLGHAGLALLRRLGRAPTFARLGEGRGVTTNLED